MPVKVKHKTFRRKKKTFDCVEFKRQMQAAVHARYSGMSPEEARIASERNLEISADPLAVWWRSLPESPKRKSK